MESTTEISDCKKLLDELGDEELVKDHEKLLRLSWILEHLPNQVAPRLQRDYDSCMVRSHDLLTKLFDKIDLSNKSVLDSFLKLLLAYGHLRICQITYHIETVRDEYFNNLVHTPEIVKSKWYDMTPLLPSPPEDSSLTWKDILVHSLVIDETQLFQTAFRLLIQKLHFHAILMSLNRYSHCTDQILHSGENVAEKIGEKLFDFAHDDYELIGIDSFLFNLLVPFTDIDQRAAILESLILARLKTQILEDPRLKESKGIIKLNDLISKHVMNDSELQEILITKLIEQLKCNIIRRKRRHSIEAIEENVEHTLESCLGGILNSQDATELMLKSAELEISNKKLQRTYLAEWVDFVSKILKTNSLTPRSSSILLQAFSTILITTSQYLDNDLTNEICITMSKIIESTSQRWSQSFFKVCGPEYLIEFTKSLSERTTLLNLFDTPIRHFYGSYFLKYIGISILVKNSTNSDRFANFITLICDASLGKDKSHILEYMLLRELAKFVDNINVKGCSKSLNQYLEHNKFISKKLYKFIKRNLTPRNRDASSDSEGSPVKYQKENGHAEIEDTFQTQAAAIDSLVCILRIAVEKKEQDTLDMYGELMLKLYNLMCSRVDEIIKIIRVGGQCTWIPIDSHLSTLMSLYIENKDIIGPYLCSDVSETISHILISDDSNDEKMTNIKLAKKDSYNEIKTKLDALQDRGDNSELVYQTLINRQYNTVTNQSVARTDAIKREDSCCAKSIRHMRAILELTNVLFYNCDNKIYNHILGRTLTDLDQCDALDHSKFLYLLLIIESLLMKPSKDSTNLATFKESIHRISCSLIRISKLVELGPSIHSFTQPGSHKSVGAIQCCTYSNCIKIFTLIFRRYPSSEMDPFITDAMQLCVSSDLSRYAKYSSRLHHLFVQLSTAIAGLLKSICMSRKQGDTLRGAMPIYLSMFMALVRCIIMASDRQKLKELPRLQMNGHGSSMEIDNSEYESYPTRVAKVKTSKVCKSYEAKLEQLSHDVGRLMNNLSFLESKLVDYAPHVITTYIKDTQRASCPDFVKRHLDEGVFRIFNLIDAFQKERREEISEAGIQRRIPAARAGGSLFDMIHARLDQASREIFKNMYDDYIRFHRYKGKC